MSYFLSLFYISDYIEYFGIQQVSHIIDRSFNPKIRLEKKINIFINNKESVQDMVEPEYKARKKREIQRSFFGTSCLSGFQSFNYRSCLSISNCLSDGHFNSKLPLQWSLPKLPPRCRWDWPRFRWLFRWFFLLFHFQRWRWRLSLVPGLLSRAGFAIISVHP